MHTIHATSRSEPPPWALHQRALFADLSAAALAASERYSQPDGTATFVHDVDDLYEARAGRGALYALGGSDALRDVHRREWEATTRFYDETGPGSEHPEYLAQVHEGYYNLCVPFEWFHQGEGNQALYEFGLSEPEVDAHRERAARFADVMTGPPNYDPARRVLRSPYVSATGPLLHADDVTGKGGGLAFARMILSYLYGGRTDLIAVRASLHPVVSQLEADWDTDPARRDEILALFDRLILGCDVPTNLATAGLATHAFLYTGQDRYRTWVLDYTQAWIERIRANGGMLPDNIGPGGGIGEGRDGQWWGGLYGWNSRWAADINFGALTVAAECAVLLSGDLGYLDVLRLPLQARLERGRTTPEGRLELPKRYGLTEDGSEGWIEYAPGRLLEFAHLYHASLSAADRGLIEQLRDGDVAADWNEVESLPDRRSQQAEYSRFQYYDGRNPDWPERILTAEAAHCHMHWEKIRAETRDNEALLRGNQWPPNPVVTKGLTQMTTGAPQTVYNGGLLRATVRHFDLETGRPGLPPDVAALVDELAADGVGLHLVNTGDAQRTVLVQAGAFGEHEFVHVTADGGTQEPITAGHLAVVLPAGTATRVAAGLRRFARTPSYGAALELLGSGTAD